MDSGRPPGTPPSSGPLSPAVGAVGNGHVLLQTHSSVAVPSAVRRDRFLDMDDGARADSDDDDAEDDDGERSEDGSLEEILLDDGRRKREFRTSGTSSKLRYPLEPLKLAAVSSFAMLSFFLTCLSLAILHENRPLTPPLPDVIIDKLVFSAWGLTACEHMITLQTTAAILVIIFHRHRFVVVNRVVFIIGIGYIYRAITMFVTVLPVADPNQFCSPKENSTLTSSEAIKRAFSILSGLGLSINGHHTYCGDYIYSGHTMILVFTHLVMQEYTPPRFFLLPWLTFFNSALAVFLLLLARGHYTVDVIIAYFVITRLWCTYHTLAHHSSLKRATLANSFSTLWWFRAFAWIEANVKAGPLPNSFNWPLPSRFSSLLTRLCKRRRPNKRLARQKRTP